MNNELPFSLELRNIYFFYNSVAFIQNVNLTLQNGIIHALVGEHGSGKSSLASIISGQNMPDSGYILINNKKVQFHSLNDSLKYGIKTIYQKVLLNRNFSVSEYLLFSNKVINKGIFINQSKMISFTINIFQKYNININPNALIKTLTLSELTLIEIIQSLLTPTKLLIIDERLDYLSTEHYNIVINILKEKVSNGLSILLITHNIDDIYNIANVVSIMKNGKILITDNVKNIDKFSLLRLTYTQISKSLDIKGDIEYFNNLLKYNEAILRFLPVSLLVIDLNERVALVNNNCLKFFGLKDSYCNLNIKDLFGLENTDLLDMIIEGLHTNEEKAYYRVKMILKSGEITANIKTMPIKDFNTVIGNIIILEDVSAFENLQDKLILSEKLASIGLLAAGVAHEINNPLEIIYNYIAYLKYNILDEKLIKIVDTIQEEISAISEIVSNLVNFSNKTIIEIEDVNIENTLEEILSLLKYSAEHKHINIKYNKQTYNTIVRINRNEFKQVILNIIKNSFEAITNGGNIEITSIINIMNENQFTAKIIISDDGPGIDEYQLKNIFLPFYSTKKGQKSNLGLGLSISYSIIQKYNGNIYAYNNPSKGCSVVVELPILNTLDKDLLLNRNSDNCNELNFTTC